MCVKIFKPLCKLYNFEGKISTLKHFGQNPIFQDLVRFLGRIDRRFWGTAEPIYTYFHFSSFLAAVKKRYLHRGFIGNYILKILSEICRHSIAKDSKNMQIRWLCKTKKGRESIPSLTDREISGCDRDRTHNRGSEMIRGSPCRYRFSYSNQR